MNPFHEILSKQKFDETGPGTILADFRTLLEFFEQDVKSSGKNHRIPLAALSDLDARMTHPLRPNLERPQLMAYPHLTGLFLLARASEIVVARGAEVSGRLTIDSGRRSEWNSLNPTEQYMTLFQTMLTTNWSLIDSLQSKTLGLWSEILRLQGALKVLHIRAVKGGRPARSAFSVWAGQGSYALLELFGMLEIPRMKPKKGENWRIGSPVQMTEFGTAFLERLFDLSNFERFYQIVHPRRFNMHPEWIGDLYREEFPACRRTFSTTHVVTPKANRKNSVDDVWQFKISMGSKIWRRIQIQSKLTVEEFVDVILDTIEFEERDHLYRFSLRTSAGKDVTIGDPRDDEPDYLADELTIAKLPLEPEMSMKFHFDFGADWRFDVKLEKCLAPDPSLATWRLIESKGDAPQQYPDDEEEFDDED